ncbi:MAG: anaerobic ribonucleoside-triphosphate reductase activating protein [Gemmatimonadota bacterium]|nr:anaerobic ribonucleoside-triphosphate reductase activating protein [Gemmatimonadota bacterium]
METSVENTVHTAGRCSPVYALLRKTSFIDYPGRLARVLFISGCNLRCSFCHNWELIKHQETSIEWERLEQILQASRENWVDAVCISGGEPTLHPLIEELVLWLKGLGFRVKLDTNGTRPGVLEKLLPHLDYVAMDYKAPRANYREVAGHPALDVDNITESIRLIRHWEGDYEIRTTVVEGMHSEDDMLAICRELAGVRRYVLQGYVPLRDSEGEINPDLPSQRTSRHLLRRYRDLCREHFKETILRGE